MPSSLANMWAWPSCSVQHGVSSFISQKIVQCDWSITFGEFIVKIDLKFFVCCIIFLFLYRPYSPDILPVKQLI